MYTFIFYGIIIAIFLSLFFDIDLQKIRNFDFSENKVEEITQIKKIKKIEKYSYTDRIKR